MVGKENMRGKAFGLLWAGFLVLALSGVCLAAHPLITDDTGTQGKGKAQLEAQYEFDHTDTGGVEESVHQIQAVVSYGIIDTVDLVVALPYHSITTREAGVKTREAGISDMTVEIKWRFFEKDGFSLAVKPGISIPTGDHEKGLGAGKVGGGGVLIATQELEPFTFHFNAGYGRNETTTEEEETDLWHVSLATEYEIFKWVKAVANVGADRNPDKADDTPAAFFLGGFIFPITDNVDFSVGAKAGLTEPEVDYGVLAGMTFRF